MFQQKLWAVWNPLNVEVTGSFIFIYIVNLSLYILTLEEGKFKWFPVSLKLEFYWSEKLVSCLRHSVIESSSSLGSVGTLCVVSCVRIFRILTPAQLPQFCLIHVNYSRTPLIWTLVIRIANYPDRLGPSGKHCLTVIVVHLVYILNFCPICQIHIRNYVLILYLYVNKYVA
jgi:hypothetical protein